MKINNIPSDVIADKASFCSLVLEILPIVKNFLEAKMTSELKGRISLDDVLQDTFINAMKGFSNFHYHSHPQTVGWVKRIATNIIRNRIRENARMAKFAPILDSKNTLEEMIADSGVLQPIEILDESELKQAIRMTLASLPDHYKQILIMRHMKFLSFNEIALELKKKPGACRGLHRNAIKAFELSFKELSKFISSRLLKKRDCPSQSDFRG